MSTATFKPWSIGSACVQRVDHGEGQPLTLDQATEQVEHPLTGLSRQQLVEVVAYLSCQVVGRSHDVNADALLAMHQIQTAVREYERRHSPAVTTELTAVPSLADANGHPKP